MPCMHACLALNIGTKTRAAMTNGWHAVADIASLLKCIFTCTPPLSTLLRLYM